MRKVYSSIALRKVAKIPVTSPRDLFVGSRLESSNLTNPSSPLTSNVENDNRKALHRAPTPNIVVDDPALHHHEGRSAVTLRDMVRSIDQSREIYGYNGFKT